jgi:Xaa-Pro aminopeptidase
MLTIEGCRARRARLWEEMPWDCDFSLITHPQHLTYFANYAQSPFVFRSNEAGAILVLEPDRCTLIGDNLVQPFLDQAHVDMIEAPLWYEGKRSAPIRESVRLAKAAALIARMPGGRIGVEPGSLAECLADALRSSRNSLELFDLGPLIMRLRRTKDSDELALLRRSLAASDAGMAAGLLGITPGMTELDAFLLVQRACLEAATEQAIVYGDFLSGPRCEQVGGPPSERKIARGDLMILDFSVVLHGYRGDVSNTFRVGEPPSSRQTDLFHASVDAMHAGESLFRAGIPASEVDAAVRSSFARNGLATSFRGHSGHGIGLGHPEAPFFVPESEDVLLAGDVVTLEPGQYIPGECGMRFEQNYVITSNGFETLSGHRLTMTQ